MVVDAVFFFAFYVFAGGQVFQVISYAVFCFHWLWGFGGFRNVMVHLLLPLLLLFFIHFRDLAHYYELGLEHAVLLIIFEIAIGEFGIMIWMIAFNLEVLSDFLLVL